MEPTASPIPTAVPVSDPSAVRGPLPRPVVWAAVLVAAALPAILLVTAVVVMLGLNYNFLNWME